MFNIDHYAISVKNMDKSVEFYKKLDFMTIKEWMSEDKNTHIVHMKNGSFILEMFCYKDYNLLPAFVDSLNTDLKTLGSKHIGLCVDDLEVAANYLIEKEIISSFPTIAPGRMGRPYFFIKDPNGIFVEIIKKM
jgi:glyoxylase I family protein